MIRILGIFLCFLFSNYAIAQDSPLADDSLSLKYRNLGRFSNVKTENYFDLQEFRRYQPIPNGTVAFATSGNNGLPSHSLLFQSQSWNSTALSTAFLPLLFTKDSLRFYNSSRPFTQLSYFNGAEEEQQFQIFHTQNLGEGMNLAFNYRKISSTGFYPRQLTAHTQFNATIGLKSRDQRFTSDLFYIFNDVENQENGGVIVVDENEDNDDPILLDVNFSSGVQNQTRVQNWGAKSEYNIIQTDSLKKPRLSISHEFNWLKAYRTYTDDTTNTSVAEFYDNFFFDTGSANDSSFSQTISNEVRLNVAGELLQLGVRNEQLSWFQNFFIDEEATSNFIVASTKFNLSGTVLSSEFEKGVSGFHENEIDWSTTLQLKEWKEIVSRFNFKTSRKQVDFLFANQRANHHYYSNALNTVNENKLGANFFHRKSRISVNLNYRLLGNFTYLDSLQSPMQSEDEISVIRARVGKELTFLKNFHFNNYLYFQSISNKELLPLPSFTSFHSLFYSNEFFKKALVFQVGADLAYIGNYNGYAYSPSLAQFHLRETTGTDLGNQVQLDLFINMRIRKTARIFVKMENITAPSFSVESSRIADYSLPGRVLKFGLSWRMLN